MEGAIRIVGTGLAALFLVSSVVCVEAQSFPSKPVTVIVPAPPGGTADISMRIIAHKLNENLGQQIVVDNRPGAGGIIASQLAIKAAPDGYTVLMNYTSHAVNPSLYTKLPYDSVKDFAPVTLLGITPLILVVHPSVPANTIAEFIAYAKANPGKLNYGSAAIGGASHLGGELLNIKARIDIVHIPYKGGAEAITAFLGKHTDFLGGSGSHLPYVKQGAFRQILIYNADKRDPAYPDVPILKDLGCEDCPPTSMVLAGPKGMPDPVFKKIYDAFKKVADGPEFQNQLKQLNLPYEFKDRARLEKDLPMETEWYRTFLKKFGVK